MQQSRIFEECAFFQANLVVREANAGNMDDAKKVQRRLFQTLNAAPYPDLSARRLAKRLGRDKALAVGIDKAIVEDGIRNWQKYTL